MTLRWYGHSCFMIRTVGGPKVLTDPCDPDTGYVLEPESIRCTAVTVSHQHSDHNYTACVHPASNAAVITEPGRYEVCEGLTIEGFGTYHDPEKGALRGKNTIFVYEMEGMRIAHLGDIGHCLDDAAVLAMQPIDILLVPVGGVYTVDYADAAAITYTLRPKVVVPMHYQTSQLTLPKTLDDAKQFIEAMPYRRIHRVNDAVVTLHKDTLGKDRLILLDPCAPANK